VSENNVSRETKKGRNNMDFDFEPFFLKYESLLQLADATFSKVKADFPECVTCKISCADCCHALFDLSLIEALYINHHFNRKFEGREKEKRLQIANEIDRKVYKLKREAYRSLEAGKDETEILNQMAEHRVRCPLLNDADTCDLYEHRPITCRIYGIPTTIGGKSHTCGITGFKEGESYPTVNIDVLHQKLYDISAELVASIQSRFTRMAEMLVPLSMALLTDYNSEYMGCVMPADNDRDRDAQCRR
jgi:Fe-S-cluster containining protein